MTLSILSFNKSRKIFNGEPHKMKNLIKRKKVTWQRKIALKFLSFENVSKNLATLLNCWWFFNIIYKLKINCCVVGQFVYYFEDKRVKIIRGRWCIYEEVRKEIIIILKWCERKKLINRLYQDLRISVKYRKFC